MSDVECDLDELTAFLEASDGEETADNNNSDDEQLKKDGRELDDGKGDECDLDEISAFLDASDDDDDDENGCVKRQTSENEDKVHKVEDEEEKVVHKIDGDVIRGMDSNDEDREVNGNDTEEAVTDGKDDNEDTGAGTMQNADEFEDIDDADFDELENLMSQSKTQSTENDELQSRLGGDQSEDVSMVTSDAEPSDEEEIAHNAIKAEMAAMAERMQQLQKLLEKKSPVSTSKHKHSQKQKHSTEKHACKDKNKSVAAEIVNKRSSHEQNSHSDHKSRGSVHKSDTDNKRPSSDKHKHSHHESRDSGVKVKSPGTPNTDKRKVHKESRGTPSTDKRKGHKESPGTPSTDKRKAHKESPGTPSTDKRKVHKESVQTKDKQILSKDKNKGPEADESNPFFPSKKTSTDRIRDIPDKTTKTQTQETPATCFYKKTEDPPPVDARSIFGESDDSDWDELDGGEKSKLSVEGKEMKRLMNTGSKKREAHTANYDTAVLNKSSACRSTWAGGRSLPKASVFQSTFTPKVQQPTQPDKPLLDPETGTVSGKYRVKDEYRQKPASSDVPKEDVREIVTDPFCGIRIINPRISMAEFKQKMSGRQLLSVSRLLSKYGTADLQKDNWVTMGVVVHKTEPRQSAAGKPYCIWKLSDLQNCEKTITFFLFGNVYKEHWKNDQGVVIGLLNPSLMDKAEKSQNEVAFTINHPQQLLMMGISKDLGRCKSTTKSGQPCSSFINKHQGEFCTYHVQAAYRKTSSKRTELQASTGVVPKAFEQKKRSSNNGCFFYGGQTFTSMKPQTKSSQDKITIRKLQSQEARKSLGKVTTMSLHELEPEHEMKLQKIKEKDKNLLDLLTVPTAGAMNFVKHLVKKDTVTEENTDGTGSVIPSVSAKDLLKQHQKTLQQQKRIVDPLAAMPKLGKGLGTGQEISLDAPVKKVQTKASVEFAKQLAIAKIKARGGLEKQDPNAVRKKLTSPEAREKIRKRVVEDVVDTEKKSSSDPECAEPPRKKSKLLGNLDLNSPEVKKLMEAKSKHTGALAEAEAEHEEKYFSALEKRERMEEKMDSIKEVPVTLAHCVQCKYTWFTVHDRCKKENHVIKRVKGTKRFFKCKTCKTRTISIDKIPTSACKNCGGCDYERVSMLKERSGPKTGSEELSLRGNEQKFVGSLQGKTYLNV